MIPSNHRRGWSSWDLLWNVLGPELAGASGNLTGEDDMLLYDLAPEVEQPCRGTGTSGMLCVGKQDVVCSSLGFRYRSLIWPAVLDVDRDMTGELAAEWLRPKIGLELHLGRKEEFCRTGEQGDIAGSLIVQLRWYVLTGLDAIDGPGGSLRRTGLADEHRLCSGDRTLPVTWLRVILCDRACGCGGGLRGTDS